MVEYQIVPYEEKRWTVYIHISPSNKYYVGITSRNPTDRWGRNGKGYQNKCHHFWNAIQKYGWDNIQHRIILENLTRREAELAERYLIKFFQSSNKKYGYNISKGGTGGNQKKTYPVKMYDKDGGFIAEYESAAECARIIGIPRSPITRCCKHGGTTHGYMFCYSHNEINDSFRRTNQRDIYKFDLDGNYIDKYRTFAEAVKKNKGANLIRLRGAITRYVSHYYNGFIWVYEEDICNVKGYIEKSKKIMNCFKKE